MPFRFLRIGSFSHKSMVSSKSGVFMVTSAGVFMVSAAAVCPLYITLVGRNSKSIPVLGCSSIWMIPLEVDNPDIPTGNVLTSG